jgi:hypothetical protein
LAEAGTGNRGVAGYQGQSHLHPIPTPVDGDSFRKEGINNQTTSINTGDNVISYDSFQERNESSGHRS